MSMSRNDTRPRHDYRRSNDDTDYRADGSFACLDSEWDDMLDDRSYGASGRGTANRYGGAE